MSVTNYRSAEEAEVSELSDTDSEPHTSRLANLNLSVLLQIRQKLNANPEADIRALIPLSYKSSFTQREVKPSAAASLNRYTLESLQRMTEDCPEIELQAGHPLGGLGGEGAKDAHSEEYKSKKAIYDVAGFEDFKFSISHFASESYVRILRTLLPPRKRYSVFTHGDLWPANIMVKMDANNDCIITVIIDWEDSGFYPDFHEATKCTNFLYSNTKSDWFDYLPSCVAPSSFPEWWLVDRLLDINIRTAQ